MRKYLFVVTALLTFSGFAMANQNGSTKSAASNGYQVISDQNSIQAKIGIKPGDVIKSFDGVAITSPQQAMDLYNKLGTAGAHEVVIERNSKQEKIKYEIAQDFKLIK